MGAHAPLVKPSSPLGDKWIFLLTLNKNMGIIAFMQFPLNGRGVQVIRENQDTLSEKQSLPERGQWKSKPMLSGIRESL